MDEYERVAAHNVFPIALWRDEAAREATLWPMLREACADIAASAGRKLATDVLHREDQDYEYARDIDGPVAALVPCDEAAADAVRCRLTTWTRPA